MASARIALEASVLRSDARVKLLDRGDILIEIRGATFGVKVLVSDLISAYSDV
jgi:hypothetical protein